MLIRELGVRCPVTIKPFASSDEAIGLMWQHDVRQLLVSDSARLAGIITDADLLESVAMLTRAERLAMGQAVTTEELVVADIMDPHCPCLSPDELVTDAANRMLVEKRSAIPIVDETRLLGVVTAEDLLHLFAGSCWLSCPDTRREPVAHYGSRVLKRIRPDDTLAAAATFLSGSRVRHLLVVDGPQFLGMLSDWDIRLAIGEHGAGEWLDRHVRDYMVEGVQTLRPRDTLACAAEVMRIEKLTAIPITSREGELLSIITVTDILRHWPALFRLSHDEQGVGSRKVQQLLKC